MKTRIVQMGKVMSFLTCHPQMNLALFGGLCSLTLSLSLSLSLSAECNLVSSGRNCVWVLKIGLEVRETGAALNLSRVGVWARS